MRIIIGLGTGRCGTQSLAKLINEQANAVCFHEINPACMTWDSTPGTVRTMVREFTDVMAGGPREVTIDLSSPHRDDPMQRLHSLPRVEVMGDIAMYYLPYVPLMAQMGVDIRFVCIKRDREATIRSFVRKMHTVDWRTAPGTSLLRDLLRQSEPRQYRNHFVSHDGTRWLPDPKWDKLFPKFDAASLEEALGLYWDHYYAEAEALKARFPGMVDIFPMEALNSEEGQAAILSFCGFDQAPVLKRIHANATPA